MDINKNNFTDFLPRSVLVKSQNREFRKDYHGKRAPKVLIVHIRWDDRCGNGQNSFAITGDLYERTQENGESSVRHKDGVLLYLGSGGCLHEEIAEHFPELAPLIKWHSTSSGGPLHYLANTTYFAGKKDFAMARHAAVWPDASDEILSLPKPLLEEVLLRRLPDLMTEFKKDIEGLGFTY